MARLIFISHSDQSFQGWETARVVQARIMAGITQITKAQTGDIAVVSHGAVGTLLYCHLLSVQIARGANSIRGTIGLRRVQR